jgi:hypothetical protein
MGTEERKNIEKPKQQKGYSDKDIYLKLESIEKKLKSVENNIDSSKRTQIRIGLYALGAAFVILGLSLWSDFLQLIGIDTARGSINPIGYIILGSITIISAHIVSRPRRKAKKK